MAQKYDFSIASLGKATIPSPIKMSTVHGDTIANYVRDDEAVLYHISAKRELRTLLLIPIIFLNLRDRGKKHTLILPTSTLLLLPAGAVSRT